MGEIEPYYSDAQVAALLDPTGKRIKARSIRSEREAGRLVGTRVAGKWMYRKSDVLIFLEAARRCPEETRAHGSLSGSSPVPSRSFTSNGQTAAEASGTQRGYLPPLLTRKPPPKTSSAGGSNKAPEHAETAQVIPIR
jgi:hypothetical protein